MSVRWYGDQVVAKIENRLAHNIEGAASLAYESIVRFTPVRTGRLRDSIAIRQLKFGFEVYSDLYYAPYVEFGTARMAPRAMFRRGLAAVRNSMARMMSR